MHVLYSQIVYTSVDLYSSEMEEDEHNSMVFPSYEIDDRQEISQGTIANLRDFSRDVCTTFLQYVPMTSRGGKR